MKCKVTTGAGLRGLVKYQTSKDGATFIDGSQASQKDFLREIAALRALRPDCAKLALHISLSLPEGERLDETRWKEVCESFRHKMHLDSHSFFSVRHCDTDHDHIHIAACMIGPDGKRWDSNKSAIRAQAACSEIEKEMGLTVTRTLAEFRQEEGHRRRTVRDGSTNEFRRTGKVKTTVQRAIQARYSKEKENKNESDRETHNVHTDGKNEHPRKIREAGSRTDTRFPANQSAVTAHQMPRTTPDRNQVAQIADPLLKEKNIMNEKELIERTRRESGAFAARQEERRQEKERKRFEARSRRDVAERATKGIPLIIVARDENKEECVIEQHGERHQMRSPFPPTLDGRLSNRDAPGIQSAFDLFWQGRDRPSFRWHSDSGQVQLLAKPTEKNVTALFDIARDSSLKPPLRIFGTPEFQLMACAEARRIGVEVHPDNDHIARQHEAELSEMRKMAEFKMLREAADREAEQVRRANEICAAEAQKRPAEKPTWRPTT